MVTARGKRWKNWLFKRWKLCTHATFDSRSRSSTVQEVLRLVSLASRKQRCDSLSTPSRAVAQLLRSTKALSRFEGRTERRVVFLGACRIVNHRPSETNALRWNCGRSELRDWLSRLMPWSSVHGTLRSKASLGYHRHGHQAPPRKDEVETVYCIKGNAASTNFTDTGVVLEQAVEKTYSLGGVAH